MTREDQITFMHALSDNILADLTAKVKAGKIPEEWDGHELRALLASRFNESAAMSQIMSNRRGKRARLLQRTAHGESVGRSAQASAWSVRLTALGAGPMPADGRKQQGGSK